MFTLNEVTLNRELLVEILHTLEGLTEIVDEASLSDDQLNKFLELNPITEGILEQIDEILLTQ